MTREITPKITKHRTDLSFNMLYLKLQKSHGKLAEYNNQKTSKRNAAKCCGLGLRCTDVSEKQQLQRTFYYLVKVFCTYLSYANPCKEIPEVYT